MSEVITNQVGRNLQDSVKKFLGGAFNNGVKLDATDEGRKLGELIHKDPNNSILNRAPAVQSIKHLLLKADRKSDLNTARLLHETTGKILELAAEKSEAKASATKIKDQDPKTKLEADMKKATELIENGAEVTFHNAAIFPENWKGRKLNAEEQARSFRVTVAGLPETNFDITFARTDNLQQLGLITKINGLEGSSKLSPLTDTLRPLNLSLIKAFKNQNLSLKNSSQAK